jgi:hypothetical protein
MPRKRQSVFINVPFDRRYTKLFRALVFTVHDCGFISRCALEGDDGSQARLAKLFDIIRDSPLGIHDLSRTTLDRANRLPRFNMPLELGMFLGAKRYGDRRQRLKSCLILERDRFRYQAFCSDLAGQDIRAHNNSVADAIAATRNWLQSARGGRAFPSGAMIERHYLQFRIDLPKMCSRAGVPIGDLTFLDYRTFVSGWIAENVLPTRAST